MHHGFFCCQGDEVLQVRLVRGGVCRGMLAGTGGRFPLAAYTSIRTFARTYMLHFRAQARQTLERCAYSYAGDRPFEMCIARV